MTTPTPTKRAMKKAVEKPEPKRQIILETKLVQIGELTGFHKNPKIGNIDKIAESLRRNGQYRAIIVNVGTKTGRKNEILAGNHTWLAARKEQWDEIMVSFVDVDDVAATRINVADNKTAEDGSYDYEILADLLSDLPDLVGTGYSNLELDGILESVQSIVDTTLSDAQRAMEIRQQMEDRERKAKTFAGAPLGEETDDMLDEDDMPAVVHRGGKAVDDDADGKAPTEPDQLLGAPGELQGMLTLKPADQCHFDTVGYWGIPRLIPELLCTPDDMPCEPDELDSWAGSACKDWPNDDQWWLYNWGIDSTSGMKDVSKVIMSFYCVDDETEILSKRGWLHGSEVTLDDIVLCMDPDDHQMKWSPVRRFNRFRYTGKMHYLTGTGIDALVTPGHKFLTRHAATGVQSIKTVDYLTKRDILLLMGDAMQEDSPSVYTDAFVELAGWAVTEGHYSTYERKRDGGSTKYVTISQKLGTDGERRIRQSLKLVGAAWSESNSGTNCRSFRIKSTIAEALHQVAPSRTMTNEFMASLSPYQRDLLIETMIDADGTRSKTFDHFFQKDKAATDAFVALCAMAGRATTTRVRQQDTSINGYTYTDTPIYQATVLKRKTVSGQNGLDFHGGFRDKRGGGGWHGTSNFSSATNEPTVDYDGMVWCPTTDYGTFVARRNGKVYVTGNCFDDYFENWYYYPDRYTAKVINSGIKHILTPDYSQETFMMKVDALWNLMRSRWVGRYFQEAGLKVIPNITWIDGDMEWLEKQVLATLPKHVPMIAMQMQTIDPDTVTGGIDHYIAQVQKVIDTLTPDGILLYIGKQARKLIDDGAWDFHGAKMWIVNSRLEKLAEKAKARGRKTTI
jgi:ParB-like chromosome segregation protein Spo0J